MTVAFVVTLYSDVLLLFGTLDVVDAVVHLVVDLDLGRGDGIVGGRLVAEGLQGGQGPLQMVLLLK